MNDNEFNNVLVRYLQLCEAFCDSDFWTYEAKQAIELYDRGDKIIASRCMAIALYESLCKAKGLIGTNINGRSNEIKDIAKKIKSNFDRVSDIKDTLTNNKPINVNIWITELLINYFDFDNNIEINRDFFERITKLVAEKPLE